MGRFVPLSVVNHRFYPRHILTPVTRKIQITTSTFDFKMTDNTDVDDYDKLQFQQRLKAALHFTTLQIVRQVSAEKEVVCSKQLVASISETAWRQCQSFAEDIEMFAKHAKRSTVNADDIKLLTRKTPKLHQHISEMQEKLNDSKQTTKKPKKSKKKATSSVAMETDEDSNLG